MSSFVLIFLFSCQKSDNAASAGNTPTTSNVLVPDVYKKIYGASSITADDNYVYIKSPGLPDHKSVYYGSSNALYESFSGITFKGNMFSKNPNSIASQSYTFKIPINPIEATNKSATPLGPIGVSLNGVPFSISMLAPISLSPMKW